MTDTIFILDEHLKTKLVLTINGKNTFFNDSYSMTLDNCTETYQFETNVTNIDESDYVIFMYHGQYKLFQITEIEQTHEEGEIITYCYSECACLELLNSVVRPFSGEFNVISFFRHILEGSGWAIGDYSSRLADKVVNVKIDKTTQIWSVIQDCMADFGYEINTRCIYENGRVKSKVIDIYDELGNKTYKRFEYGRNVNSITKKKDLYDFATALILDTNQEIVDLEYNRDGYVKSKGSDVIFATNENNQYNLGKSYIYGTYEDNDSQSGQEVIEKAVESLKARAVPHFDFEVSNCMTVDEINSINLGDTVYVIDHTFNPSIMLEARVGELEISFSDRNNNKCNLSNYKEIKSKIKSMDTVYQELLDYINQLEVGILTQQQISILEDYVERIGLENDEINKIIEELRKIANDNFNEVERHKVYGENVNITLNEGQNYYCQDNISFIKFLAPSSYSDDYEVTLTFTTRDDEPTRIYQDNAIWLVGDDSCDIMDTVNGVLLPKCDCSYTIVVTKNDDPIIPRDFVGTVTKVNNGTTEYVNFTPTTDYVTEIKPVMKSYYDNRDKFMYKQTTPYSFTNPQANSSKWITDSKYHCDCSTFVGMCCRGIAYEDSIYADINNSAYDCSTKYKWSFAMARTASDQVRYCLENGWVLDLDVTKQSDWSKLQTGDLVFWAKRTDNGESNATVNARFGQVGHVAIVSTVNSEGMPVTYESTSMELCFYNRQLINNHPDKLLFFARPRK